jgi:hypothetical protein
VAVLGFNNSALGETPFAAPYEPAGRRERGPVFCDKAAGFRSDLHTI